MLIKLCFNILAGLVHFGPIENYPGLVKLIQLEQSEKILIILHLELYQFLYDFIIANVFNSYNESK